MVRSSATRVVADLRRMPRQFWLLVAGTVVYLIGIDLCFPFETLYLTDRLDISMTTVGLVIGLMSFVGVPFQFPAGTITDRVGRRPVLMVGIIGSIQLYLGVAFGPSLWIVVLAFAIEAACGWSLYLTASNAMIADLVPFEERGEAYSLIRVAINVGATIGPLLASLILALGGSLRVCFILGPAVCGLFLIMVLLFFKETRPRGSTDEGATPELECPEPAAPAAPQPVPPVEDTVVSGRGGYARVLRDTRFLLFLAAALLPLYCFAQLWVTLPVLMSDLHGISAQTWGLLSAFYAVVSAVMQYPLVRALRHRDAVGLIGVGSLLMGGSLGGLAFAPYGVPTFLLMVGLAAGIVLFMPLVPTVVSHMAPVDLRGRYMGVWTLVFIGGYGLGPLLGGWAMDALGAHGAYLVVAAVGTVGALAFFAIAAARRRSRATEQLA